jgi:Spx/MgsR family transcriptional regulator
MSKTIIYGIPNCDTVKKVFAWFKKHDLPFEFHNYKTESISAAKLKEWDKQVGWQTFFNKNSTTWKELSPAFEKETLAQAKAFKLMQEHNSIIKRPVIETNGTILVGFNEAAYSKQFL